MKLTMGGGTILSYQASDFTSAVHNVLAASPEISIGIRPHALHAGEGPLKGKVISCQWLGGQTHIAVDIDGRTFVSVAHERVSLKPGGDVTLNVAAADLHLFDPGNGQAIAHGGSLA